jgi:uroporphyrinogen-III synthase
MAQFRPTLVLTRPLPQSRRFAAEFRERFGESWPVVISPLSEIRHLDAELPRDLPGELIFTSENAVAAFARLSADRRPHAWCVGPRTAAAAARAGFAVTAGPGDARGLAQALIAKKSAHRLLYVRGRAVAHDIEKDLNRAGIETARAVVYEQIDCAPSDEVFSPLGAARMAKLVPACAPLWVAAISLRAADALPIQPVRLAIAAHPDAPALLDSLSALIAAGRAG